MCKIIEVPGSAEVSRLRNNAYIISIVFGSIYISGGAMSEATCPVANYDGR